MPLDIDAATPCAARELRVLPRRDRDPGLPVELLELFEHDRARGHVDPEREGLRREDDAQELALEELLDNFLEGRKHPGVVAAMPRSRWSSHSQ